MLKTIFYRIVLVLAGVTLALDSLALADFFLHPLGTDYNFHSTLYRAVTVLVLMPLNLLAGFLIIRRVPGNIVGPLLIVWSGTVAYNSIREKIGPVLFSLFDYHALVFGWTALFLMLMHFPDGKINPPGAASWIYRQLGIHFFLANFIFLSTENFQSPTRLANPFYLPALQKYAGFIIGLALLFVSSILLLALISPVLHYRKGSPRERQQIKWLALFAGFIVLHTLLVGIVYPLLTGGQLMNPGTNLAGMFYYLATALFPPLAIGVAVLRHRLWDIDLIIRRTLVYSLLTAILSIVYFGSIAVLQRLFTALTGQGSQAATVLSTLGIAVLFAPLRRGIQE